MFHFYQVNYNYCGYSQHSHNKISGFQCLYQLYTYIISQSYHHLTAAGSDDVPLQLLLFLADFFHLHQLLEGLLVSAYLPRYPLFFSEHSIGYNRFSGRPIIFFDGRSTFAERTC